MPKITQPILFSVFKSYMYNIYILHKMNTYIVKYSCNCQENDGKQVYGYMYIKHSILNLYASRVLQILTCFHLISFLCYILSNTHVFQSRYSLMSKSASMSMIVSYFTIKNIGGKFRENLETINLSYMQ